jgi:hypothetical protein
LKLASAAFTVSTALAAFGTALLATLALVAASFENWEA